MVNNNVFINSQLLISRKHHEEISGYVRGNNAIKEPPFKRFIDAWWLAFNIGVYNDTRAELISETRKFNDGSILSSDPWRITFLELVGIGKFDSDAVFSPNKIIILANEYANAGFLILLDILRGQQDPTVALFSSDFLENCISKSNEIMI